METHPATPNARPQDCSKDGTRMHREEFKRACARLAFARLAPAEMDVAFDRIDIRSNEHIDLNAFSTFILARFEEVQGLAGGGGGGASGSNGKAAPALVNHYNAPSRVDELVPRPPIPTAHQEGTWTTATGTSPAPARGR